MNNLFKPAVYPINVRNKTKIINWLNNQGENLIGGV